MSMTKEQQRIAIAEFHGWKFKKASNADTYAWFDENGNRASEWLEGFTKEEMVRYTPDYPGDLNAMHKVEPHLDQFQAVHYPENLFEVVTGAKWGGNMGYFMPQFTRASSENRSEAFCRTVWPEKWA